MEQTKHSLGTIMQQGYLAGGKLEPASSNPYPADSWKHDIWADGREMGLAQKSNRSH